MIKIRDNQELLVDLLQKCRGIIINRKRNKERVLVRTGVAKRISRAKGLLPKGVTFFMYGGWRSVESQMRIFDKYCHSFRKRNPEWSEERVKKEVKKFVHPWKGNNASGHLTGGAIDLTLYDVRNKRLMPMESSKLTFVENSMTKQTELPNYIKRNRELLQRVMKEVGFVNYPREYWHWSYGDVRWARIMGKKRAIYGVIN